MSEPKPICAAEAIKMKYQQTSKGIILTLSLSPDDVTDALSRFPIGEVFKIYITTNEIGI